MEQKRTAKKLLRILLPLISLTLFILALRVLFHELRTYDFKSVINYFNDLPAARLTLAVISVLMSYFMLTGNDVLGLKYVRHRLPYGKIVFTSFTGYAFSNSIGYSVLSGGAIRYRFYSSWGLSTLEIAKVVLFCFISVVIGYLSIAGVAFTVEGESIPSFMHFHVPIRTVRPLGVVFIGLLALYFAMTLFWKRPVQIRKMQFTFPSPSLAALQVGISTLDWFFAGSVLYLLLPPNTGIPILHFIGIFLLGQLAGLASQVPGGLGVFEMVMVLLLPKGVTSAEVMGALLSFRILYYFAPLMLAGLMFGSYEILQRRVEAGKRIGTQERGLYRAAPQVFAGITFAAGAVLLISGAVPPLRVRMEFLSRFIPLLAIDISHFAGSIVGLCLLLLARGIQQRVSAAYYTVIAFLVAGIVLALLRGMHYIEAAVLAVILLALIPARREFYRRASLVDQRFTLEWSIAVLLVVLTSLWLGLFSFRNLGYSDELWWQFSLKSNASRFVRASVGVAVVLLAFAIHRLLRPVSFKPALPDTRQLERVRAVIEQSPDPGAPRALLGDKALLFSESGRSFIMYGVYGRSWVSLGGPIGPEEEWKEVILEYRDLCSRYGGLPVFYEVAEEHASLYRDMGLSLLELGEEAWVSLPDFAIKGGQQNDISRIFDQVTGQGWIFEVVGPENVPDVLNDLGRVSDEWHAMKGKRERGFSIGFFNPEYLKACLQAVIKKRGSVVAFANLLKGTEKDTFTVDFMRYGLDAPDNVMELLIFELILWGKQHGYRWFNLGMAPLAGLEKDELSPVWDRIGTLMFRHGEHFDDFQGLRAFMGMFGPVWKPRYLALPGGLYLPGVLMDAASLVSRGKT